MITALANLRPVPLLLLASVIAAALVVARRRRRLPAPRLALLGATLLAVGGVLVIAFRFQLPIDPAAAFRWEPDGPIRFVSDFAISDEIRLNVLLLVPACLLATVLTRRPFVVLLAGIATSVLCECVQGISHSGVPDASDALAGSLGATLGTLGGCFVLLFLSRRRPSRGVVLPTAILATAVAGLLVSMPLAAAAYSADAAARLQSRLEGVSYHDLVAWSHGSSHTEDLERRVWGAGRTRASASRYLARSAQVLYPSSFMLVRQCHLATWTSEKLVIQERSDAICRATWG